MAFKDRPLFRRTLELDGLLRRPRGITTADLAARWESSTKTVQRHLAYMRDEFEAPIAFDRSRGTFRYSDPAYRLPWLPVEGRDLFTIGVAMRVLQIYDGTPIARDMKAVFDRLAELMPKEVRVAPASLVERLFVQTHPVRVVLPEVWDTVVTALNERMAVEVEYVKPGQPAVWRTLQPYALILATSGWLVPARDANDPDGAVVKIFHLSRMRTARATTARYAIPRDFSPEDYLGDTIGTFKGKPFRFRVRFAASLASFVQEVRWHPRQTLKVLESGEVELDLPSESTWEARRFVLSFGRLARAVSPPELVAEVAEELRASAGLYP